MVTLKTADPDSISDLTMTHNTGATSTSQKVFAGRGAPSPSLTSCPLHKDLGMLLFIHVTLRWRGCLLFSSLMLGLGCGSESHRAQALGGV